jgi:hypothetical protein
MPLPVVTGGVATFLAFIMVSPRLLVGGARKVAPQAHTVLRGGPAFLETRRLAVGFFGGLLGVRAKRGHRIFLHHRSFGLGPVSSR